MANDAKLGLVLGVAIVLVIALVFFRTDLQTAKTPAEPTHRATITREHTPRAHLEAVQR